MVGGADMPARLDTGWYVRPTLFSDAHNDMRIAREEIFGPVLTVISYRDEDEAIRIANDSEYGLAGSVFTADVDRGYGVAGRVRSGTFGVNEGYIMDPAAPFGGVKNSGYGRELGRPCGRCVCRSVERHHRLPTDHLIAVADYQCTRRHRVDDSVVLRDEAAVGRWRGRRDQFGAVADPHTAVAVLTARSLADRDPRVRRAAECDVPMTKSAEHAAAATVTRRVQSR